MDIEELLGFKPRVAIVFALGGGGDIVSAAAHAELLERLGVRTILAAIAWERFVVDPCPGPVRLEEFTGVSRLEHVAVAHGECVGVRLCGCLGGLVVPQACRIAGLTRRPVYILNAWSGALGVARGLEEVASIHGADAVIGVDVGGDVLAEGLEGGLWSPLADSVGFAAIASTSLEAILAVQSPCADGELSIEEVLERLGDAAGSSALLSARLLTRLEARVIEELVGGGAVTEAGMVQVLALRGVRGWLALRGGARRAPVSVLQALVFYLDARRFYHAAPLARLASGTWSLEEARSRLNEAGVYTELDLEEELWRRACRGVEADPRRVRSEGRARLRRLLLELD